MFQNNVILTKTESLTMNSRPKDPKTARNKNVLVIGGSGSGKTRFWLKPNLMQMHSSYVVTDPKGTILVECGKMLQRGAPKLGKDGKPMKDKHGKVIYEPYRIKVLNTINFKKSMHYNPFAYIHSEKDILKLVTTLIANTKGEGKAGDDFWVKAETLLYCALIGYIHYEAPVEEQNFSTLIEFINAMEVREDDEEFKNPVDLMFDALESEKPNHFAVRQYKKYKLAAGVVCSKRLLTVVVNDAADFAGTNGCYLYQGRDVKEDKDKSLKDQILVIAPHEGFVSADVWLRCRKKLMTNTTFQNGRKARNTWLAGKIKCGKCGYALKTTHNPSGYEYLRCSKRADHKGCPGCGTLRKTEFEQFIFTAMGEKFREFKLLRGGEEKANPKITAYQVELAQVEAEIEKLLDTLTGANATLLAYANKKIEDLDNRRKTLSKAIADLSVETLSSQQIELLSGYLDDWENISFEDKRKAADGLISSISATSDYVKIEWKI